MIDHSEQRILMGNEAIGRGLVEEGCTLAAAYPGTPASEILSSVVAFAKETGAALHTEWSVNEKVACETALANSMAGRRSAVAMKQVGLNVAADPFTRAAFYAIRSTFPAGIFPSDIGCYTLGMNFGAVDTCHCMGACIGQGAGFYRAYAAGGADFPTIVVTIGDSTFFHAGIPGLINAVLQGARFILVILDNATTAMTGHQPTPQLGVRADGSEGRKVFIPDIVRACGVRRLREIDPYDVEAFTAALKEADTFIRSPGGDIVVLIAGPPLHREPGGAPGAGRVRDEHHGRLRRLPGLHRCVRMPGHPL